MSNLNISKDQRKKKKASAILQPIHIETISMELSISYNKGLSVKIFIKLSISDPENIFGLSEEERAGCFTLIVFLLPCGC